MEETDPPPDGRSCAVAAAMGGNGHFKKVYLCALSPPSFMVRLGFADSRVRERLGAVCLPGGGVAEGDRKLRISFQSQEEFRREYESSLFNGGVFVPTHESFEPRETVRIELQLSYRVPFDWERLLAFMAARAIPGREEVRDGIYRRVFERDRYVSLDYHDYVKPVPARREDGVLGPDTSWVPKARPER